MTILASIIISALNSDITQILSKKKADNEVIDSKAIWGSLKCKLSQQVLNLGTRQL